MARKNAATSSSSSVTTTPTSSSTLSPPETAQTMEPPPPLHTALTSLLTSIIPKTTLSTLLESRTTARSPTNLRITHLSPHSLSITFDQPVRQYWYKPILQIAHITIPSLPTPPPVPASLELILPKLPEGSGNSGSLWDTTKEDKARAEVEARIADLVSSKVPGSQRWAEKVKMAVEAAVKSEDETKVTRYVPPETVVEWLGVAVFLGFTVVILAWIFGVRGWLERWVFKSEGRFDVAVMVHAVVLVKRSGDAKKVGELCKRQWGGGKGGEWSWRVSAWVEGWRAVGRWKREVERVERERVEGEMKKK